MTSNNAGSKNNWEKQSEYMKNIHLCYVTSLSTCKCDSTEPLMTAEVPADTFASPFIDSQFNVVTSSDNVYIIV